MLVADTSTKASEIILEQEFCIQYLVKFRKDKKTIQTLINSSSKVNTMTSAYTPMLGVKICPTSVKAPKIDNYSFKTFGIIIASFQVKDKLDRAWFFQETFLLANISMELVLGILFYNFSNADI